MVGAEGALDALLQAMLIFRSARQLPGAFCYLEGCHAQFHLHRLAINVHEERSLLVAMAREGVRLPEANLQFRIARPWCAIIEPIEAAEISLPDDWLDLLEIEPIEIIAHPRWG